MSTSCLSQLYDKDLSMYVYLMQQMRVYSLKHVKRICKFVMIIWLALFYIYEGWVATVTEAKKKPIKIPGVTHAIVKVCSRCKVCICLYISRENVLCCCHFVRLIIFDSFTFHTPLEKKWNLYFPHHGRLILANNFHHDHVFH